MNNQSNLYKILFEKQKTRDYDGLYKMIVDFSQEILEDNNATDRLPLLYLGLLSRNQYDCAKVLRYAVSKMPRCSERTTLRRRFKAARYLMLGKKKVLEELDKIEREWEEYDKLF